MSVYHNVVTYGKIFIKKEKQQLVNDDRKVIKKSLWYYKIMIQ